MEKEFDVVEVRELTTEELDMVSGGGVPGGYTDQPIEKPH